MNVEVFNLVVDVDVVGVQNLGVVEGLEDGGLDGVREEGVFVGGFVAPDEGLEFFLFGEVPVEEREVAVGDLEGAGGVDGLIWRIVSLGCGE